MTGWFPFEQVANLVASEFFEQGDIEKNQLHIKPKVICAEAGPPARLAGGGTLQEGIVATDKAIHKVKAHRQ